MAFSSVFLPFKPQLQSYKWCVLYERFERLASTVHTTTAVLLFQKFYNQHDHKISGKEARLWGTVLTSWRLRA